MELIKQDVLVPISPSDKGELKRYFTYLGEQVLFKEKKQVYVLTEEELDSIKQQAFN